MTASQWWKPVQPKHFETNSEETELQLFKQEIVRNEERTPWKVMIVWPTVVEDNHNYEKEDDWPMN